MDYLRFLRLPDYVGLISEYHMQQVSDDYSEEKFKKVEEDSEICILEYMSENYMIEDALAVGKTILDYNDRITYPAGIWFWAEDPEREVFETKFIVKTLVPLQGKMVPETIAYWQLRAILPTDPDEIETYSQVSDYYVGDIVERDGDYYDCLANNGYSFQNIRVPGAVNDWELIASTTADEYDPERDDYVTGDIVELDGLYFQAMSDDVNGDKPQLGVNVYRNDPRNKNIKKHLARLALYEMHKGISPNNISATVFGDWEYSMMWLKKCNDLKINPQIDRRTSEDGKISVDWAISSLSGSTMGNDWVT